MAFMVLALPQACSLPDGCHKGWCPRTVGLACALFMQIFTKRYKFGVWDIKAVFDSGGMPSSHSALCMVRPCTPSHGVPA